MNEALARKIKDLYASKALLWILIFTGVALRINRFVQNPSLYFDEANTAIDIISRPFSELLQSSPDYDQVYPLSFLLLNKLAITLLGNSEYTFRLLPAFLGILSVFLFYRVARHCLETEAVPITLLLFVILDPLVYYSSIIKPYSGDVAFTLVIFAITFFIQSNRLTLPRVIIFALTGAAVIWLSNSSVFVLAGIGAVMAVSCIIRGEWPRLRGLSIVYFFWAVSFIIYYLGYMENAMSNITLGTAEILKKEGAFMPVPPKSMADIKWFVDMFFNTFNFHDQFDSGGQRYNLTGLVAFAFIVGGISLYRRSTETFFLTAAPMAFTLLASALHQYPFKGRLILFLAPLMLLFVGEGIKRIWSKTGNGFSLPGIIFVGMLLVYPLSWAAYHFGKPFSHSDVRPVLDHAKRNWQDGDILYVHYFAQYEFDYYSQYHPQPFTFDENEYITGIAPRGWYLRWKKQHLSKYYDPGETAPQTRNDILYQYVRDLNQLRGHSRVWILFSGQTSQGSIREEDFFLFHLDSIGRRLDTFGRSATSIIYLYDMSAQGTPSGSA